MVEWGAVGRVKNVEKQWREMEDSDGSKTTFFFPIYMREKFPFCVGVIIIYHPIINITVCFEKIFRYNGY